MKADPAASSGNDDEVAASETTSDAAVGNKQVAAEPNPEAMPEPKVVAVRAELLSKDYIEYLLKHPIKRPKPLPESFYERFPDAPKDLIANCALNKVADFDEDILKEYKEKGYAVVGVELLDNGRKRLFSLSEEEAAAACLSLGKEGVLPAASSPDLSV